MGMHLLRGSDFFNWIFGFSAIYIYYFILLLQTQSVLNKILKYPNCTSVQYIAVMISVLHNEFIYNDVYLIIDTNHMVTSKLWY